MQSVPVFIDPCAHRRPPSLHMTVIAFFPSAADDPVLYGTPSSFSLCLCLHPLSRSIPLLPPYRGKELHAAITMRQCKLDDGVQRFWQAVVRVHPTLSGHLLQMK